MKTMKVAILSAGTAPIYYDNLHKRIDELMETSQCFLFYILCGYIEGCHSKQKTLGEIWAENNGAPVLYISEKTVDELMYKVCSEADYIFFLIDGDPIINKTLMKYKMMGKHGTVIYIPKEK